MPHIARMALLLSALVTLPLIQMPAIAATGPPAGSCDTAASDARLVGAADAGIGIAVYRGREALAFLAALVALAGPSPVDLSHTSAIVTLSGHPGTMPEVAIRFYDDDRGCVFYAASTSLAGLALVLAHMGAAA